MSAVGQKINAPFFQFQSNEKAGRAIPNLYLNHGCHVASGEDPSGSGETGAAQTSSVENDAA